MDLWQLHIFCKVVELKSFSRAAKAVHLSQPTVSSHIKDLEDHSGFRLIDRFAKAVVPTPAGNILYDYARRLIALRDEAETALAEFQGKVRGRLAVGGSTIPGTYILPRMIGPFVSRYPEVTLSIVTGDSAKIMEDILSGTLELGVVGAKSEDSRLVQKKLVEDRLCLIVPGTHRWQRRKRIFLKDLMQEPFLIRKQGSGTLRAIQTGLARRGSRIEELNIVAEMGSTEAVCQGIKSRAGVSVLSPRAVAEELKAGMLKALEIEDLNLTQRFYLTTYQYKTISPLGNKFVSYLKREITNI